MEELPLFHIQNQDTTVTHTVLLLKKPMFFHSAKKVQQVQVHAILSNHMEQISTSHTPTQDNA